MELRDLRAFATLGELLHFGQAAERMHVTQSALSKQIQRLEVRVDEAQTARRVAEITEDEYFGALLDKLDKVKSRAGRSRRPDATSTASRA